MRAVLDTNVLVSAILIPRGHPATIVAAWRRGDFQLVTSAPLLEELANVLLRPRIRRRLAGSPDDIANFLLDLQQTAIVAAPSFELSVVRDAADNRVIEAAVAARADYVVSGDQDLTDLGSYREVSIVTPARFAAVLSTLPAGG